MRNPVLLLLLVIAPTAGAQVRSISDLQWLAGCWERTVATGRTVEFWAPPSGNLMSGASYAITDSTMREREQLRLWTVGDTLVYEAHPASQARTEFRMHMGDAGTELGFENPLHDFPQRIVYRRQGADSLIARIEGDRAGRRNPITFPFKRVECGAVGPSPSLMARAQLQPLYDDMAAKEQREPGSRYLWYAEHGLPDYRFVLWSTPGSTVAVWDNAILRGNAQAVRRGTASSPTRVLSFTVASTVERVLVRGDTLEALVRNVFTRLLSGAAGQPNADERHERKTTQLLIDTWVRQGAAQKLRSTQAVSEIVLVDGQPEVIDGRFIPRPPR
jgi:hypothetical protein